MALRITLTLLCSLAALSSTTQDETILQHCTSQTQLLKNLSADFKGAVVCGNDLPSAWTTQETAALLLAMRNVTDMLHNHLLQECHGAEPKNCSEAKVPHNGGMACVTVANKRYCKPLCEHGYDFAFVRRSRPYDECSEQTRFRWQTQYVGGNKLAVCHGEAARPASRSYTCGKECAVIESAIQISGAKTAYFPKDQDCLTTKSSDKLQSSVIADLTSELKNQGVLGAPQSACLVCG